MFSFRIKATTKQISFLLLLVTTNLLTGQGFTLAKSSGAISASSKVNTIKVAQAENSQSTEKVCSSQLSSAIEQVTGQTKFSRSRWGILIQTLNPNQTLYSRDAQKYFIPASNTKLLTTAAALHQLGSQYRIRTSISGYPQIWRVIGRGDPSLTATQLRELAQQLKRKGYTQVEKLILDDGYFKGNLVNPTWEWEDVQAYYGAPINSLILNQNAVVLSLKPQAVGQPLQVNWADDWAVIGWQIKNDTMTKPANSEAGVDAGYDLGSSVLRIKGQLPIDAQPRPLAVAVLNPVEQFGSYFRRILALEGITVKDIAILSNAEMKGEEELAAVESAPLAQLLQELNQNSNNVYAEALLRSLGISANTANSAEAGLAVVKKVLTDLGVNPEGFVLKDGSGLSRHNLVTPEAIVQTLTAMAKTPEASVYKASLPVAGVSGTLSKRFKNTTAQGIVYAKTGTMTGVSSISGYVDAPNHSPLVFSIIVNQSDQSVATIRQAMDEVVVLLTRLHRC